MNSVGPIVRNELSAQSTDVVVQAGIVHGGIHVYQRQNSAVPRQLPATPSHFTGRTNELQVLESSLADDPQRMRAATILVTGPGGVGKTALALQWLHSRRDRFPDGHLYANLRSHSTESVAATPTDVLAGFLVSLGVTSGDLPTTVMGRAALYRSLTADKQIAVLLDDAVSPSQVHSLLPSSASSAVLVTSRQWLSGLATHVDRVVPLAPLASSAALELLSQAVGPQRVDAEPQSARRLAELCGGMPIALRVVAALLVTRPQWRLARVGTDLEDEHRRLGALETRDRAVSVEASLDLSYRDLPPEPARLYRLLGSYPGVDFGAGVAAAMSGLSAREAESLLDLLAESNLVTAAAMNHYRFHDLIRLHARQCAERHDPEFARIKATWTAVLWFLDQAVAADQVVTPLRWRLGDRHQAAPTAQYDTSDLALDWLERELPNLMACLRIAFTHEWDDLVWQLCEAMWGLFLFRSHFSEWILSGELAVRAAARAGNQVAQCRMQLQLAAAHVRLGDVQTASDGYQEALEIARETEHWRGEVTALEGLGSVAHARGNLPEAIEYYRQSLGLSEKHGRTRGVALMHCFLGYALNDAGDYEAAIASFRRSADIAASIDDHHCRAQAYAGLGAAHARQGRFAEAIEEMTEGLTSLSPSAAPALRVHVLEKLGEITMRAGDPGQARRHWEQARDMYVAMADPRADHVGALLDSLDP